MNIRITISKTFVLLALFSFNLNAQPTLTVWGNLEFQGEVDATNRILSNSINVLKYSSITLTSTDGNLSKTITANNYHRNRNINFEQGKFMFHNIPEGSYYLTVRTSIQGNKDIWRGTFKFKKPNPIAAAFPAGKYAGYVGDFKVRANSSINYNPKY